MEIWRCSTWFVTTLALGVLAVPTQCYGQADKSTTDCNCQAVLEKKDEVAFRIMTRKLDELKDSSNEQETTFYRRFKESGGGGDGTFFGGAGFLDIGGGGGTKSEEERSREFQLWRSLQRYTNNVVDATKTDSVQSREAIAAWRDCILKCIGTPEPKRGLSLQFEPSKHDAEIKVTVQWNRAIDDDRGLPKIVKVRSFGLLNANEIEQALEGKSIGVREVTIRRKSAKEETATIEIETDFCGSVAEVLPRSIDVPPVERIWTDQQLVARRFGDPLVASAGAFADKIAVAWAPVDHKLFAQAYKVTVYWSLSPNDWDPQRSIDTGTGRLEVSLTPRIWAQRMAGKADDPSTPKTMPRGVPIYFRAGFSYRPNGKDATPREHLFAKDPVVGWLPREVPSVLSGDKSTK